MRDIVQKIEDLSMAIVMVDLTDLQTLGDLYKKFNEISTLALNESEELAASAATAAGKLIEDMIMGEVPDKQAAYETISQIASGIQAIIVNRMLPKDVRFPVGLGIEDIDGAGPTQEPVAESGGTSQKTPDTVTDVPEISKEQLTTISDPELAADFVSEAREHLHEADVQLLTLEDDPKNKDALDSVYRAFHTIKGVAGFLSLDEITKLSHVTEDLLDNARKGDIILAGPAIDVTFEAVDGLKQMIDDVEEALSSGKLVSRNELLSTLLPAIRSVVSGTEEAPPEEEEDSEQPLVLLDPKDTRPEEKEEEIEVKETEVTTEEQEIQKQGTEAPILEVPDTTKPATTAARVKETLKIDAERMDMLVDMIGELVIAESMISQDGEILEMASPRVSRNLSHLNKITRELQEIGMSMRLMSVRPVFERMARLVRDLSKKAGKKVHFSMSGEDTEVDKTIVEKISDPLTHMIRNAVDHGIESDPADRLKANKPETGSVELRAFHRAGNIYIEIEDDGKGLDKDAILAKAKERGMIMDSQSMTDQEVFNLIFAPGFSTAKVVTDVSGRGVGMDVVNRNIQALRGQVDISSVLGKGTTFSLRLPLTLAIIDGIVVQVGMERYIIPTLSVVESLKPSESELPTVLNSGEMVSVRGRLLPLFRISHLFGIDSAEEDPTKALVVIVEDSDRQVGLLVDDLIGHQQVVIKSLGGILGNITGVSGGAIMADGRVGLILDVGGIVRLATGAIDVMAV